MSATDREETDLELIAASRGGHDPAGREAQPLLLRPRELRGARGGGRADGLVLFNRFYQPDLDLETFDVLTKVSLSHPSELRMPLRWIAILRPQLGAGVGLAATSGIHEGTDAVKALLVGPMSRWWRRRSCVTGRSRSGGSGRVSSPG